MGKVRIVLQPVNFRDKKKGRKHKGLPDHDMEQLIAWNRACLSLLEAYFGNGRVILAPLMDQKIKIDGDDGFCRRDLQGLITTNGQPVIQVNSKALVGASTERLRSLGSESEDVETENEETTALVYCIAPHMYSNLDNELAWCYSTRLSDYDHAPWVVSTFQVMNAVDDQDERIFYYCSIVFYAVLNQLGDLSCCENDSCAMQNSDSMEEAQDSRHFILCAGCIRKLQLCGAWKDEDVPELLQLVHDTLSKEPFAGACHGDIQKLQDYGCRAAA